MRNILSALVLAGVALAGGGAVRGDDKTEAAAILDKGIQALGGEARLAKFKAATWKAKGKFFGFGDTPAEYTGEWAVQLPDQMRVSIEIESDGNSFKQVRVLNGNTAWIKRNNEDAEAMSKDELADEKKQVNSLWLATLLPLKDKAFTLKPLGELTINDRPAVGLKAEAQDGRVYYLFFDKETGLLLKNEYLVKDRRADKDVKQEVIYSDWKEVDGIKRAMKVTVKRDGKLYTEQEISDFKPAEKLDDKTFAKP
jgi:outer membrane lipoprotein-sorting protein